MQEPMDDFTPHEIDVSILKSEVINLKERMKYYESPRFIESIIKNLKLVIDHGLEYPDIKYERDTDADILAKARKFIISKGLDSEFNKFCYKEYKKEQGNKWE